MSEQMMQEILQRLDSIGAKLGEGGTAIWQTLVRQAYIVEGWYSFVVDTGIALALFVAAWFAARYFWKLIEEDEPAEELAVFTLAVAVVGTVVGLILLGYAAHSVRYILNPEYHALLALSKLIGK